MYIFQKESSKENRKPYCSMNVKTGKKSIWYLISFALPSLIMMFAFATIGCFPGGDVMPLVLDLRSQQTAFFNYINNLSEGFNSISYQSLGALGGNVIDPLQMCCSPLILLFSSCNYSVIPWNIWGIIIILIGLAGTSEFIYLKNGNLNISDNFRALLISTSYALMSCFVIFTIVPVWLWGGGILPLVALGIDRIIENNKYVIFCLAIVSIIILNYYMAYIIIMFSVIYFLYRMAVLKKTAAETIHIGIRCFLCGIVCAGVSAVSWFPVFADLLNGKAIENRHINYGFIRSPLSVLQSLLPMNYNGLNKHSSPFVFCGTLTVVLILLYYTDKKETVRNKLITSIFLSIFILCFCVGIFDISWMFFSEPNGYPSRYSFVFSFFLLYVASKRIETISINVNKIKCWISRCIIIFLCIGEMYCNAVYLLRSMNEDVGPYSGYAEYIRVFNTMNSINDQYQISGDAQRTVKNWRYTNNDGILFGYEDIDYSSSGYNYSLFAFLEKLGMNGQYHLIRSTGITPVVSSVLGVNEYIQYGSSLEDYFTFLGSIDGLDIYENSSCLPIAYAISDDMHYEDFRDNPFENINVLMKDLCGAEDVFELMPCKKMDNNLITTTSADEHLWAYIKPVYGSSKDIQFDGAEDLYYIYESGMPICEYANALSPYCVDLGVGNGSEVEFSLNPGVNTDSFYFASYNKENANKALDCLRNNSAYDIYCSSKGLVFSIDLSERSNILITIPYIKGYSIFVDGEKTEYYSYRDALVMINADGGHHDITIIYKDYWVYLGGFVSGLFILCIVIWILTRKRGYISKAIKTIKASEINGYLGMKLGISTLITILMVTGYNVKNNFGISIARLVLYFIIAFFIIYIIISFIYRHMDRSFVVDGKRKISNVFFKSYLILMISYLISFLGLYPGIFAFDAPTQVQMYFTDSISEWHPVLHTVFLGKMIELSYGLGGDIILGVALYTVFQSAIIAFCFSYMLRFVYYKTKNVYCWGVSLLYLAVFPTICLQVVSATKDSFFMAFYVLSMTLTIELLDDDEFMEKKIKPILLISSYTLMIINRNNCIYAFPVLAVLTIMMCKKKRNAAVIMLATIILFLLYKVVFVDQYVTVNVDGREKLSLPAQQLTMIYNSDDAVITDAERDIICNLITERGRDGIIKESADIVKASINMDYYESHRFEVIRCYINVVINNPKVAIESFCYLTCGFWYPIYDLTLYGQGEKGYWVIGSFYPYYIDSKIPPLLRYYQFFGRSDFNNKLMVPFFLLFAPAAFFYAFCIVFGYALVNKNRSFIPVLFFTLIFWATYMLGPMALVRYTTYLFAIVPLYTVIIKKKKYE